MTIDTLTFTLTDKRSIDGIVSVVNRQNVGRTADEWVTPEQFWSEQAGELAKKFANDEKVGVITSAAFVGRFTPLEYSGIIAAADTDPDVDALVSEVMGNAYIYLDDPRLSPGLDLLEAKQLIDTGRKAQILSYDRPEPTPPPAPPAPEGDDTVAGGAGEGE